MIENVVTESERKKKDTGNRNNGQFSLMAGMPTNYSLTLV